MQNKMIETVKEDVSKLGRLELDQDDTVLVRKQIGKTTYLVRVHFSQTSKETMQDKIGRMIRDEIRYISEDNRKNFAIVECDDGSHNN